MDTSVSNEKTLLSNSGVPDAVKRMMDSILKAEGPNVTISIEGASQTKIEDSETKNLKASDLKLINYRILDSLISVTKKKYTLVHFWATWCGPCREEFPRLIKDASYMNNADIILVSSDYDSDEQKKKVLAVYKKLNTRIPVYINQIYDKSDGMGTEAQRGLIKHYGLNSDGGLPYNILIENKTKKALKGSWDYNELIILVK